MGKCWSCGVCQECTQKEKCTCVNDKKKHENNIINFGKYKGMTFKDIRSEDASYLMWLYTNVPKNKIEMHLYHYIRYNADEIGDESTKQKRKTGWTK